MNKSKKENNNTVTLIQYNNLRTELNNKLFGLNKVIDDLNKQNKTCDKDKTIKVAQLTTDKTNLEYSVKELNGRIRVLSNDLDALNYKYNALDAGRKADSIKLRELNDTLNSTKKELNNKDLLLLTANAEVKECQNKYDNLYDTAKEMDEFKNSYEVRTIALQDVTKDNIDSPSKCADYVEKMFRDYSKEFNNELKITVEREKNEHEEKILKQLYDFDPEFTRKFLSRPKPTITAVSYDMDNQLETEDEISHPMDTITYTKQPTKTVEGLAYGPQYDINGNCIQYDKYRNGVYYDQILSNFTGLLFMLVFVVCFISAMYLIAKEQPQKLKLQN
jgi:hypothetical protein